MRAFLAENWMWIAAPIVVYALIVLVAVLVSGDGDTPFEYALF